MNISINALYGYFHKCPLCPKCLRSKPHIIIIIIITISTTLKANNSCLSKILVSWDASWTVSFTQYQHKRNNVARVLPTPRDLKIQQQISIQPEFTKRGQAGSTLLHTPVRNFVLLSISSRWNGLPCRTICFTLSEVELKEKNTKRSIKTWLYFFSLINVCGSVPSVFGGWGPSTGLDL